jgi:hypothetical protein
MNAESILDEESTVATSEVAATETTALLSSTPATSENDAQKSETPGDTSNKSRTSGNRAEQTFSAPRVAQSVPTPARQFNFQRSPRSLGTSKAERAACRFCQYTVLLVCLAFLTYWMASSICSVPPIDSTWEWFLGDDDKLLPGNDDNSTHAPSQLPTPHPTPTAPPSDDESRSFS